MIYSDRIYGHFKIKSPVLIDLINSKALQRPHGIMQHGITGMIGICSTSTRFEHSLGVMKLVQLLGGTIKEQIAALLHDVSHTAFSHVIDHVFRQAETQSYHEEKKEWFFTQSDLPDILNQHGYQWQDFLDEEQYLTLEYPAPSLCADRVDYLLRDTLDLNLISAEDIKSILLSLTTVDKRIVCKNIESAKQMAMAYMKADEKSWSDFREVGLYEITAQAVQRGLDVGLITEIDLWQTDKVLYQKLQSSDDPKLKQLVNLISPKTQFKWETQNPHFTIRTKIRVIDPDVIHQNQLKRLSELDEAFNSIMKEYIALRSNPLPYHVIGYPKR